VNGYLLDASVAILAMKDPALLTATVREAISQGQNVLSTAAYWEVVIKTMKGKLSVGDPRVWWKRTLADLVARPLPILPAHIEELYDLALLHRDPFDRIQIAQATVEELTLLTTDEAIQRYHLARFRVIA